MSDGTPKPATCPRCRGPLAYGHATATRMRCCRRFGKSFLRDGLGLGHLTEGRLDEPRRDDRLPAAPTGDAEPNEREADGAERDQQHPPRTTPPRFHHRCHRRRRDVVRVHVSAMLARLLRHLRLPSSYPVRRGRSSSRASRPDGSRSGRHAPSMLSPRRVEPRLRYRARGGMRPCVRRCRSGSLRDTCFQRVRMRAPRRRARRTGIGRRNRRSRRLHL